MATSEAQKRATEKWKKVHGYKRIVFDVPKEFNDMFRQAAQDSGESYSMFFKKAILMRIQKEGE